MSRQTPFTRVVVTIVMVVLTGCHPQEPFYMKNVDNDAKYYVGKATQIEYPDVNADRLPDVSDAQRPWSLQNQNRDIKNVWELTLEETIQIALKNNKVMRNIGGQVQGSPEFLLRNPEAAPTIYDPALAESNPRTGPEAALSAFDAQLSTALTWDSTDAPQNVGNSVSDVFPKVSQHDLGTFQTRLQKTAATGGTFALTHSVNYDRDRYDYPTNRLLYSSDWNVKLVGEMRQPLLQGAGVQFNEIAGLGATPGVFNGVVLARIRTDIALAEFESSVRNLVSDVEVAYWELYYQYRSLDAVIAGRDSALQTWRKIYTLYSNGSKGGEAEKEAQAREQYFQFRSTAEQSLNALYSTEAKLRYLMGLAATDGRLVRPKDEPTTAKVAFDWHDVLAEGLARSVELREEKWIVKDRELQLIAAKNFLLPKLDAVATYRWLGMGNRLDGTDSLDLDSTSSSTGDTNAYRTLVDGQYQEWQVGFQGSITLGFRREMAGVRFAQLQLEKERTKLQEGELELSHQLAYAIRDLETNHVLSQTNFNRRIAAQRQVAAVQSAFDVGDVTLDVLLNAQQQLANAERDYYRSLIDYNKSIAMVHYRKGSLLEYNGVYLAEGPWPGKAYFDARRRSRSRAASTPLDYGFTQPKIISRGPVDQEAGNGSPKGSSESFEGGDLFKSDTTKQGGMPTPAPRDTESVPAPSPESVIPPEAVPEEPAAPEPVVEPTVTPKREAKPQASTSESGSGWKAVENPSAAARTIDHHVSLAGWNVVEKGKGHESDENPSSAATDRSASDWTRTQR